MKHLSHSSAKPSHYDAAAKTYDAFNEEKSKVMNSTLEQILRKYDSKTVLDLTCGTGSQVFWLTNAGFEVVGSDINSKMLNVAKIKAKEKRLSLKFLKGDMRTTKVGKFDAVLTIFNAVGHLTPADFQKAMRNIRENLNKDGIYIFDIFNLTYLLNGNNITQLTIDWQKRSGKTTIRDIQYSTINSKGVLASFTTSYVQTGASKPKITQHAQTLQVYSANQLKHMLNQAGFDVLDECAVDGSRFLENETDRMIMIAKRR